MPGGAHNLLVNCAGVKAGDSLLILHEDPELGWYDRAAPEAVADEAEHLGLRVTMMEVGGPSEDARMPDDVAAAMMRHDQTVFFCRLGDQARFSPSLTQRPPVMCYAVDADMLASDYGASDYRAFMDLKAALNRIMTTARHIRISCDLGTDLEGRPVPVDGPEDVSVKRFPLGIYQPVPNAGFRGRVALSRYLAPTGSRAYSPNIAVIPETVMAHVEGSRITNFSGPPEAVSLVDQHYRTVSGKFGIEPYYVHSWHCGMHPACSYGFRADDNPDKWANTVFPNPRTLHFHTCGAYPPGEICWMVIDPKVEVDGRILFDRGRLDTKFDDVLSGVFNRWPVLDTLFRQPPGSIGL